MSFPIEINDGKKHTIKHTNITAYNLFRIWWDGDYEYNSMVLSNEKDASLTSLCGCWFPDALLHYSYGDKDKVLFAIYEPYKEPAEPLKKECGNCEKFYQHYVKSNGTFTRTCSGHCFPKDSGEPLDVSGGDSPRRKNCFEWSEKSKAEAKAKGRRLLK